MLILLPAVSVDVPKLLKKGGLSAATVHIQSHIPSSVGGCADTAWARRSGTLMAECTAVMARPVAHGDRWFDNRSSVLDGQAVNAVISDRVWRCLFGGRPLTVAAL